MNKPVVVGVDDRAENEAVIRFAFEEAVRLGVPLVAVHACDDLSLFVKFSVAPYGVNWNQVRDQKQRILADQMVIWQEKYPEVPFDLVVVAGQASVCLLEAASNAQLVVVGTGGTADRLVRHAPCAVAVVRPDA